MKSANRCRSARMTTVSSVASQTPVQSIYVRHRSGKSLGRPHIFCTTFETRRCPARLVAVGCSASDVSLGEHQIPDTEDKDVPVVKIDNLHDPFATIVTMKLGDRIPHPLDTMATLRNLGLNIVRAKIDTSDPDSRNRFYVTDRVTSEKIIKSARLEEIRLAVLESLIHYFPETSDQLNAAHRVKLKDTRDPTVPLGPRRRIVVDTQITIRESASGSYTELLINTDDRSGLLIDVVSTLKSLNVNVVSAEVDTIGTKAHQEFMVTYHGGPLNNNMEQMVRSCLQYYLSLAEVENEESY